jgi:hypothetical protein
MQTSSHTSSSTNAFTQTSQTIAQSCKEDQELAASIRQRDKEAIEKFYEKYAGAFYAVINKTLLTEQVSLATMENTFTKIVARIEEYDPARERLFIWAYKIARKEASRQKVDLVLRQIFCCG